MARAISEKATKLSAARRVEALLDRERAALEAAVRLFEGVGTVYDPDAVGTRLLEAVAGVLAVKRASLYLVSRNSTELVPMRSLGIDRGAALGAISLECGFVRWLVETGGAVRIDEYFTEAGSAARDDEETIRPLIDAGFSSAIALAAAGDTPGALFWGGADRAVLSEDLENELVAVLVRAGSAAIDASLRDRALLESKEKLERFAGVKRACSDRAAEALKTPLSILKSTLWSLEPDRVEEGVLVEMAKDAASRLEGSVARLLSLSDIELDRADCRLEPSEVSSIVEDVLREMLPELEEKQVHVDFDDGARFRKVLIDPGKIAIVLRSMIERAVDSVSRGGSITVSIRVSGDAPGIGDVEIGSSDRRARPVRGASHLVIAVADDGIGISADDVQALSDPLHAASDPMRGGRAGIEAALLISSAIVSGHGGRLFCRSELGSGSRFSVWLPLEA